MLLILFVLDMAERSFMERLYTDYRAAMWRFAVSIIGSHEGADDVVQKAFEKLLPRAALLEGLDRKKLHAYLCVTVRHTAYDFLRAQRHDLDIDEVEAAAADGSPGEILSRLWDSEELRQCLEALPEIDRDIICLRYSHDLDYQNISKILNINSTNARVRLHRALALLRRTLAGKGGGVYGK